MAVLDADIPRDGIDLPVGGLSTREAQARLAAHGPNRLPEPPRRSRWALFIDQFRNLLVGVLFAAAILAGLVGDWKDTIVIAVVLLLNAVLGFLQEGKAERSLAALKSMLVEHARVRRDGEIAVVPASELVPGDVVLVEAGDRVPADGRLRLVASLEIDESSLTGESTPVAKSTTATPPDVPLAERTDHLFMNTTVTRGRGEVEVTATGPDTEIGKLAGMLEAADPGPTPLQADLDVLGKRLAVVAGAAVGLFLALELLRGTSLSDAVLAATALAVAAIPEGLPAVVTVTLAVGVHQLAKRGAVVKRLASVETLGSTTVICSDKTGTLTLNRMTVQEVRTDDQARLIEAVSLCSDAIVRDGSVVGDPTEGAMVELAVREGVDVESRRAARPRRAEAPFESSTKVMVTVHDADPSMAAPADASLVAYLKGAPDVLLPRCRAWADEEKRVAIQSDLERMASDGLRVLAVAERRGLAPDEIDGIDLVALDDLDLIGLVAMVDPPRPEARQAIAVCRKAGVAVKMITGDHQATATAIAHQLGLRGATLTGAQLDELDDEALGRVVDGTDVFARVSPAHKVRLVRILQDRGHVVAMTGDGVNDAPALKSADIGVAMGITGTEVTKEAADMVLTDDDFTTIVRAVESGRTIFANIVHFVRFQLSTNIGAMATMVGSVIVGLPTPFTALQVLWINLIMDGPPAMALGVDPPSGRAMDDPPRRPGTPILSGRRLGRIGVAGGIMAGGTLGVLAAFDGEPQALTLAFTTFVLFQVFNVFNVRSELDSVFSAASLRNRILWVAVAAVVVLQVMAVEVPALQRVFDTTALSLAEWALAVSVASVVLWVEEARKVLARRRPETAGPVLADRP